MSATASRPARSSRPSAGRTQLELGAVALLAAAVISGCSSQSASPTPAVQARSAAPGAAASPAPSSAPSPAPTATPATVPADAPPDPVVTLAQLVGEDTTTVYLTDWDRILGDMGVPADPATRFELLRARADAAASAFAINSSRGHREAWGWDTLDLAWEATVEGSATPLHVLALRSDTDLDSIVGHFTERDFAVDERPGAVVFSRPLNLADDWVRSTDLAIHNTAILVGPRLMILSSSPDAVERTVGVLVGDPPAAGSPAAGSRASAFLAAVGALGPVDAAVVELRVDLCPTFVPVDDPVLGPLAAQLHPWTALAAGWQTGSSGATARLAFAYADPALASADLAGRARLAREGSAVRRPLSETVFRVDDVRVDGSRIVMDVSPVGGRPARILVTFFQRDLVFAACG